MLHILNPASITSVETDINILINEIKPFARKIIGGGADGAAVNFGNRNGMIAR